MWIITSNSCVCLSLTEWLWVRDENIIPHGRQCLASWAPCWHPNTRVNFKEAIEKSGEGFHDFGYYQWNLGGHVSIIVMGTVYYKERNTWEKAHNRYFRVWIINARQKHCVIIGLVSSLWHYWVLVETVEERSCRRKLGYLRNILEGEIGALISFCLFLLPGYQGWRGALHKSPSHHRPKAEQLRDCGQILKTLRQNKPLFFLNCYLKWLHRIHVQAFGVPQKTIVIHLGKQRQILSIKGQSNKRKDCVNKGRATSDNSGDVGIRRARGKRPGEKQECSFCFGSYKPSYTQTSASGHMKQQLLEAKGEIARAARRGYCSLINRLWKKGRQCTSTWKMQGLIIP